MTSKEKGNIAVGRCIKYATSIGMVVSLPINDAQDYDLIIDNHNQLLKIQVKYITGNVVDTRVRGHQTKEGKYYIKNDVSAPDYYFITTGELKDYLIPYDRVKNKITFTLNKDYDDLVV